HDTSARSPERLAREGRCKLTVGNLVRRISVQQPRRENLCLERPVRTDLREPFGLLVTRLLPIDVFSRRCRKLDRSQTLIAHESVSVVTDTLDEFVFRIAVRYVATMLPPTDRLRHGRAVRQR